MLHTPSSSALPTHALPPCAALTLPSAICCHMLHGNYWKHQVKSKVMKGWDGLWKLFSNSRNVPHCPILSKSIEFAAFSVRFLELMPPLQVRLHLLQPSQDDHLRWNSWNVILVKHDVELIHIDPIFICVLMSFALFYLCCTLLHLGPLVSKRTKSPRARLTVHGTYARITLFRLVEICAALLAQKWQKCTKSAEHCNNSQRNLRRNSRRLRLC